MMQPTRSAFSRPLVRLALVAFAALFVAAPTPGDVGGCSSNAGLQQIPSLEGGTSGNDRGEYLFHDQGLCSHFCWRLRDCGLLCQALPADPMCLNDSARDFARCVRGALRPEVFHGTAACPHTCPTGTRFVGPAYGWDVQACGHAVLGRDCVSLQSIFDEDPMTHASNRPAECTINLCR
jgi:hypothetical protein